MKEKTRKTKSIKLNSVLYAFKVMLGIVSPLITFPYVCRVLSPESIGAVSFSNSIISYFVLLAGLGISSYAVRKGVQYREEKDKFETFVSEVFTINLCSTICAYLLFAVMLCFSEKWQEYLSLMLVISLTIPLTTLGMEWVFTIYEEYLYITLRSLIVQICSIAFLFIFVRGEEDVFAYAVFTVFVSVGSNLFNFFKVKDYCRIRIAFTKGITEHLKPILILFFSAVACQIYLHSDVTMLGYFATDREVGLYSAAAKIYNLVKTVLAVFITVSVPRLSYYAKQNEEEFRQLFCKVINVLMIFILPITIGVFVLSDEVIMIISGADYVSAGAALRIMSLTVPFSVLGSCMASGYLLPHEKEKQIMYATILGAVVNIGLNLYFIPKYGECGAALTMLIAEMLVLAVHIYNVFKAFRTQGVFKNLLQCALASVVIIPICAFLGGVFSNIYLFVITSVAVSAAVYFVLLLIFRNEMFRSVLSQMITMLKKRLGKS